MDILNIPRWRVRNNLTKIGYINRSEVWIPHQLTESNLLNRISTCDLLLQRNEKNPFLKKLFTGDETWILYENITHKWFYSRDKKPLKVAKSGLYPKKSLISIWCDWKDVIYYEFLPHGETINSVKYCSQLGKLEETIATKWAELMNTQRIVYQQDNPRIHVPLIVFYLVIGIFYLILHTLQILPRVITIHFVH